MNTSLATTIRVMIVDDHPEDLESLVEMLIEDTGFDVHLKSSSSDVLKSMQEQSYDVIVIDEVLSYQDEISQGTRLLQMIKAANPFIEVVMITGYEIKREAFQSGAFKYLRKPINLEELEATIRFAAEQRRSRREIELMNKLQSVSSTFSKSINSDTKKTIDLLYEHACKAAVEIFAADFSGVVEFSKDRSHGVGKAVFSSYYPMPLGRETGSKITIKGVPFEEDLVFRKKLIKVPDVEKEVVGLGSVWKILFIELGIKSIMIAPIMVEDVVVASISIDFTRSLRVFSDFEVRALQYLADHIGNALHTATLLNRTDALRKITHEINSEYDIDSAIPIVLKFATEHLQADNMGFYEYNRHYQTLTLVTQTHETEQRFTVLKLGEGAAGSILATNEPFMIIENYDTWEGKSEKFSDSAVLVVRFSFRSELLGVFCITDKIGRKFTPGEANWIIQVLEQVGLTSELGAMRDSHRRQLEVLQQITQEIHSTTRQDEILHIILTAVTAKYGLRLNRAALFLSDTLERPERVHTIILEGREGIGYLSDSEQRKDWEVQELKGPHSFREYLKILRAHKIPPTVIGENIRALTPLRLKTKSDDLLSRSYFEKRPIIITNVRDLILPSEFVDAFVPSVPLVVIPMCNDNNEIVGIIVADNHISGESISANTVSAITAFVMSAITAYRNARQIQLMTFVSKLALHVELNKALKYIVTGAQDFLRCDVAVLFVYDAALEQLEHPPTLSGARFKSKAEEAGKVIDQFVYDMFSLNDILVVADTDGNPTFDIRPFKRREEIKSVAVIPLIANGDKVGVLFVNFRRSQLFTKAVVEEMQQFGIQVALHIKGVYLYKKVLENRRRLRDLYSASDALISRTSDVDGGVLDRIVMQAKHTSEADFVSVILLDKDEVKAVEQKSDHILSGMLKIGDKVRKAGHISYVMKTGKTVAVENIKHYDALGFRDPETSKNITINPNTPRNRFKAFLILPLRLDGHPMGVMWFSYKKPHRFSEFEIRDLSLYATFAAVAFDDDSNKQKQFRALTLLKDATEKVKQSTTIDQILKIARESAYQLMSARYHPLGYLSHIGMVRGEQIIFESIHNSSDALSILSGITNDLTINWKKPSKNRSGKIGTVGRAVATRKNVVVVDVKTDSDHINFYHGKSPEHETNKQGSQISVLLWRDKDVYAVLSVEHPGENAFDKEDLETLESLASHISAVINGKEDDRILRAVIKVGQQILAVRRSLTEDMILAELAQHVYDVIRPNHGEQEIVCHIVRRDNNDYSKLSLIGVYPESPREIKQLRQHYRNVILSKDKLGQNLVGITGRAAINGTSENVIDVSEDADYLEVGHLSTTRSQLSIPLFVSGDYETYGVITVEHRHVGAFSLKDQEAVELLSSLADIALRNIILHDATVSLAWYGILSSLLRHSMRNEILNIKSSATFMRNLLNNKDTLNISQLKNYAEKIEKISGDYLGRFEKRNIPDKYEWQIVGVNDLLRSHIARKWDLQVATPHRDFKCQFYDQNSNPDAQIRVIPDLLTRVLDILIDNSVGANSTEVTISTQHMENRVKILISDNGSGITDTKRRTLFIRPQKQEKGHLGLGLLTAKAIVDIFSGDIAVENLSGNKGATFVIFLDVVRTDF